MCNCWHLVLCLCFTGICIWVLRADYLAVRIGPVHFQTIQALITSAEEGGYVFGSVCLSVCLSVRRITRKLVNGF